MKNHGLGKGGCINLCGLIIKHYNIQLMWTYNKTLEYPINIKCPNPRLAKFIISQYGGPDGELAASLRYLSQRFGMPDQKSKAILNDIGTEELVQ